MNDIKYIDVKLSLHPNEKLVISNTKIKMLEEELKEFGSIKENDVNLVTSYIFEEKDSYEIGIFFRNGLKNDINFNIIPLKLIDEKGQVIASKKFHLKELGNVPGYSARPYKLFFKKDEIIKGKCVNDKCKVMFSTNIKAMNIAEIEYEGIENISFEMQMFLKQSLETLPPLEIGKVDIRGYEIYFNEEKNIKVTFLIRNGSSGVAKLEKLPITVFDKNKKIIHSTLLEIKDSEVQANKARLFSFVINCDSKNLSEFDLSQLHMEFKA